MKKFIVTLVALVALFSLTANAQTDEQVVIKNGDNVTIYNIRDMGENSYGSKDFRIDVNVFKEPKVRELRAYNVPEEAWRMCSEWENGFYSSQVSKLKKALQEVKNDYQDEVEKNARLDAKNFRLAMLLTLVSLTFAAALIYYLYQLVIGKKSKK